MSFIEQLSPTIKKQEEEQGINMSDFRNEISKLIEKRKEGSVEENFGLLTINLSDLTETDARVWNKINKLNSFTRIDLDSYHQDIKKTKNNSREAFFAFIVQKLSSIWFKEEQKN